MKPRIFVCVPTYNNPGTIAEVAGDLLAETELPLLIVDDGSEEHVAGKLSGEVFQKAFESGKLFLLRHEKNIGKGAALQSAIQWGLNKGLTHMLVMDGDAQHPPKEAKKMIDACCGHPWSLIMGVRALGGETVPELSRFGRKFSNFWVRFQTEFGVGDSQSGMRVYPLFFLQDKKFYSKKFDFEIEVLVRLIWSKVEIHEVKVDCYYPPEGQRVSHFNKFWDNARITTLNIFLIIVSLLNGRTSSRQVGWALGLGVFVGCTPLFGLHSLICAAIAFFFRLNFLILFVGSQISIPIFMPALIFSSVKIGNFVLSGFQSMQNTGYSLWSYVLGSWIVGLLLGAAFGFVSAFIVSVKKRLPEKPAWTGKTRGGRLGNIFIFSWIKAFGPRATYPLLYFVVPYFYFFAPTARRALHQYWRRLDPNVGFFGRQFKILKGFYLFAQCLVDRAYQSQDSELVFSIHSKNFEMMKEAVERNSDSMVLLGAHAGSWEMAAMGMRRYGSKGALSMLRFENGGAQTFDKVLKDKGMGAGAYKQVLQSQTENPFFILKEQLERRNPVALMVDRPRLSSAELVPFLGGLLPLDSAGFRVARACKSQVVFFFGFKTGHSQYEVFSFPAKTFEGSPESNGGYFEGMCEYAKRLEEVLQKHPAQWFNFFPAFSTKPSSPS